MAIKNIDNTENGTGVLNTKLPGMDEAADIQEALRLYHYGSKTVPANESAITRPSMAGHITDIKNDVEAIKQKGTGSTYQSAEPTTVYDGLIWVDADVVGTDTYYFPAAKYQTTAPTLGLSEGLIWIKKGTSPLEMYVYDSTASAFIKVGA